MYGLIKIIIISFKSTQIKIKNHNFIDCDGKKGYLY